MPTDHKSDAPSWRNPSQISNARSFVLMTGGVLLGLVLAGYSLFTARSASTLIVPGEDVALVNQQPVSRADYVALLQTLYGVDLSHATREQRRKVLDDMIREELFVQRGKELDVASTDPDVRSALVNAVELEISENAITAQPSEAALRQFYTTHQDRYVSEGIMSVRDWVFPATALPELPGEPTALKSAIHDPQATGAPQWPRLGQDQRAMNSISPPRYISAISFSPRPGTCRTAPFRRRYAWPTASTFWIWKKTSVRFLSTSRRHVRRC